MWAFLVIVGVVIIFIIFGTPNESEIKQSLNEDDFRIQYACSRIFAIAKICNILDIPGSCVIAKGPATMNTYSMEIKWGRIRAGDSYYTLKQILTESDDDKREKYLQNLYGLSESESRGIDGGHMRFVFHDDEEDIDFSDDYLIGALPESGSAYHVKAFGMLLQEKLSNAEVEADKYIITVTFGSIIKKR